MVLGFGSRKELEDLIELHKPDILIDGGEWRHDGVGREFAKETRFFDRIGGYSSSDIIERIRDPIKFVPKGWGYEKWIANGPEYCGKILFVKGQEMFMISMN